MELALSEDGPQRNGYLSRVSFAEYISLYEELEFTGVGNRSMDGRLLTGHYVT